MDAKNKIASRIALEIKDGDVVNLGIGTPELVGNYIPEDIFVWLQSENGMLGMGRMAQGDEVDKDVINAGNKHVLTVPGGSYFDAVTSFMIIRGGHVDVTVLGVLEVDAEGTFASHKIPGVRVPGMGGAMDLVTGAKKVIIATTHTKRDGVKTIVEKLSLPTTAYKKANLIVTELAVMRVTDAGLVLEEVAEGYTPERIQEVTGPKLIISENLKTF